MLLWVLSWMSTILVGVFGTLCLAAGLFYLAELVEEYSVATRRILQMSILVLLKALLLLHTLMCSAAA